MKNIYAILVTAVSFAFINQGVAQDLTFDMEITTPKGATTVKMYVSGSQIAMVPQSPAEAGKIRFVSGKEPGKMLMLMDNQGQKMAMAFNLKDFEKSNELTKDPKITVTKETKTIDQYNCTRIISETDKNVADIWMTQDINFRYEDIYKMFNSSRGQGNSTGLPALNGMKGFPIEIVTKDKKDGNTTTIKFRQISKAKVNPEVFNTDGYQVMDLNNPKN